MTDDLRPVTIILAIELSASAQLVIKRMTGSTSLPEQIAYLRRAMTRELMHDAIGWGGWEPVLGITVIPAPHGEPTSREPRHDEQQA